MVKAAPKKKIASKKQSEQNKKAVEKLTWQNARRKLSELIPTSYNPRKLTEKQYKGLKKSLEKRLLKALVLFFCQLTWVV